MATMLEIVGPYEPEGWQDPETGEEFFNDTVMSELGIVGKLKTVEDERGLVITQADYCVLIGAELMGTNAFGYRTFELQAANGHVYYMGSDEPVQWWDQDEPDDRFRVAVLMETRWEPWDEAPPEYTSTREITVLKGDGA